MKVITRYELFLQEIAPYVVLCGSYARGEENENSDLDFYVRQKPQDPDKEPEIDTSYLPKITALAKCFGYEIDSCVVGSITLPSDSTKGRQLEFSYLYKLPVENPLGVREIDGVTFLTCIDNKEAKYDDCFDTIDDYGGIQNPLPSYEEEIRKFREHGVI